jgi:heptaprenyl diphosphate synthase
MTEIKVLPQRPRDGRLDRDMSTVLGWLRNYVGAPSARIGRPGPVCPFVPGALNAGAIRFSFHYGVDACDAGELLRLVSAELREFKETSEPPKSSGISLDSLLIVLPDAAGEGCRRIDESYGALKNVAVCAGLMIGQFHPACAEPAVRNPAFPVSRSPIALYAVRHMAPHDALFLHAERDWFEKYRMRFGSHTLRLRTDPFIHEVYRRAQARYGGGYGQAR